MHLRVWYEHSPPPSRRVSLARSDPSVRGVFFSAMITLLEELIRPPTEQLWIDELSSILDGRYNFLEAAVFMEGAHLLARREGTRNSGEINIGQPYYSSGQLDRPHSFL